MAHPPNPPGGVAPARATTGQQGGGTPAAQTTPSGPTRKVKVFVSAPTFDTSGTIQENVFDVSVITTDQDGNGVSEDARVTVANHHFGTRGVRTTNGRFSEEVRVRSGQTGVVYQAVLNNGQTDEKPLPAPAAPATPHHQTRGEKALAIFYAYGLKIASVLAGLIALLFFKAAIFGPYGLDMGENERSYLVLGGVFLAVAIAFASKAFGGGHTPSGGGH